MHILHLSARLGLGGISRYLYDLSRGLAAEGHRVTIAARSGPERALFEDGPWRWIELPLDGGGGDLWRSFLRLRQFTRNESVSVVHSHYRKSLLVGQALAATTRARSLFTLHSTLAAPSRWYRLGLGRSTPVHVAGEGAAKWLAERGVAPERITVIPHGVDLERYSEATHVIPTQAAVREKLGVAAEATVAGFVGRFTPLKNPEWVIRVAEATAAWPRPPQFILMGEGPLETSLKQRVAASQLTERVVMLPYGDPRRVYRASDLMLMPSLSEGFGLVGAEAMAMGRPVIRTTTSGAAEQVVSDAVGRVTPVEEAEFVRIAARLLSNRDRLLEMRASASAHARAHLSLERQVRRMVGLYGTLAGAERASLDDLPREFD